MGLGGQKGIKGLTQTSFLPAVFTVFPCCYTKGGHYSILSDVSSEERLVKIKRQVLLFIAGERELSRNLYVRAALHQPPAAPHWASQAPLQVKTPLPSQKLLVQPLSYIERTV